MIGEIDKKDQWYAERWGKFSASEIGKLLSTGTGNATFGKGAMTYIKKKAIEKMTVMWERPELEFVKSLLHGKAHEYPAYEMYRQVTKNFSMRYFGTDAPVFLHYDEDSGGSPDGLMGEGTNIHCGMETKCPKDSNIHYDYLGMVNQWDLREYNIEYYAQDQFLLMITKAPVWHHCSFDDRFIDPKKKIKIIEVFPDKKFQDNLQIRLQMAVKIRNSIVERQFN